MSDPIQDPAEQLLQALAVGDIDAQDARVIARFAAEPELATRWEQLAGTLAVLRSLDGLPEPGPVPEVRRLDTMAAIQAFRRESSRAAWGWRRLLPAAALVAAAVLLGWWLRPMPHDPLLGPGLQMTLAPDGVRLDAGSPLQWTAVRGADRYRLQLKPSPPFALASLTRPEWLPSTDEHSQLPSRFEWRVIALAGDVEVATSGWARTWR